MTEKMGRNPFAAKVVAKNAALGLKSASAQTTGEKKRKKSTPRSNAKAHGKASYKAPVIGTIKDWKLERLSFLRIDADTGSQPRVTVLDLRLKNAHWSGPKVLEIPLFKGKRISISFFSARIQSIY